MSVRPKPTIAVLGGGLAGPLMATYLGRAGYTVNLYEMRPDPRGGKGPAGRSINLALSLRGLHALEEIGIQDQVHALTLPMRGRTMHSLSGSLTFQPYGTEPDQVIHSISRGGLNELLLSTAEACPVVTVHYEHKGIDVDVESGSIELQDLRTGEHVTVRADIIIGADGAFSRTRTAMQRRTRFNYRQDYLDYGYKELCLPPTPGGDFALSKNALHIWPRRSYMMIALPNSDASFTCTLFWPHEGKVSFEAMGTDQEILDFFGSTFPDVTGLFPDLVKEFRANPVGPLVTIRCRPWQLGGRVVLIGDACHAVVPFYGQGMNAAFEDCSFLNTSIREHAPDWEKALRTYESLRRHDTNTLADLALDNFVEMRDHVASRSFLIRRSVGRALHRLFPRWYVPLYTMVTFSRIPYAEARRRARNQDRVVNGIAVAVLILILVVLGLSAGFQR